MSIISIFLVYKKKSINQLTLHYIETQWKQRQLSFYPIIRIPMTSQLFAIYHRNSKLPLSVFVTYSFYGLPKMQNIFLNVVNWISQVWSKLYTVYMCRRLEIEPIHMTHHAESILCVVRLNVWMCSSGLAVVHVECLHWYIYNYHWSVATVYLEWSQHFLNCSTAWVFEPDHVIPYNKWFDFYYTLLGLLYLPMK